MTALTRRHVYYRGHDAGETDVVKSNWWGKSVWFCTSNNVVVTGTITFGITRRQGAWNEGDEWKDYSIMMLSEDLPDTITPMTAFSYSFTNAGLVNGISTFADTLTPIYPVCSAPRPYVTIKQNGYLFTGIQPLIGNWTWGDSGGPWMLPIPGQLIFVYGATTSGANANMQSDIDTLTTLAGADTNNYQIQFIDWSSYPQL
jgi:hypothetical protein